MNQIPFLILLILAQVLIVTSFLRLIQVWRRVGDPVSLQQLAGKVFLLLLMVNLIAMFPHLIFVAIIVWFVGLMRLSGLDILSAFILSLLVSLIQFGVMLLLAHLVGIRLYDS